jgi:hypothetical protein
MFCRACSDRRVEKRAVSRSMCWEWLSRLLPTCLLSNLLLRCTFYFSIVFSSYVPNWDFSAQRNQTFKFEASDSMVGVIDQIVYSLILRQVIGEWWSPHHYQLSCSEVTWLSASLGFRWSVPTGIWRILYYRAKQLCITICLIVSAELVLSLLIVRSFDLDDDSVSVIPISIITPLPPQR